MKVLILEDMPDQAFVVQYQLRKLGFDCTIFFDGLTALSRAKNFDVIVTDIEMPNMDGMEFIARVRQELNTPIVVITCHVSEETKDEAFQAGANYFMTKPILPNDIKRVFSQWV